MYGSVAEEQERRGRTAQGRAGVGGASAIGGDGLPVGGANNTMTTPLLHTTAPAGGAFPPMTDERRDAFRVRRESVRNRIEAEGGLSTKSQPVLKSVIKKKKKRPEKQRSPSAGPMTAVSPTSRTLATGGDEIPGGNLGLGESLTRQEQQRQPGLQPRPTYSFLYTVLSPYSHAPEAILYKRFIATVITIDLVFFIASTDEKMADEFDDLFAFVEGVTSTIFMIEYICRLYCCTERKKYKDAGPIAGRIKYALTWPALVDLLASLPFFLELPTGWELPTLTYLRFFRLLRILKTEGYVRAVDAAYRVIYFNREILHVAVMLCVFLVLVTAVLLYYLRPPAGKDEDEDQTNQFGSIWATMYLSVMLLTGQGGPDAESLPWYTKAVLLLTSVFSVAMFAIPASMLTWGFEAEAERMAKRARYRALKQRESSLHDGEDDIFSSATSSEEEIDTDEEYFQIIAGEDPFGEESEDGESEESLLIKELRRKFAEADANFDGTLTLDEFIKMQASLLRSPSPGVPGSPASQAGPNDAAAARMDRLESKLQESNKKLDKILQLLLASKGGGK